MAIRDVERPLEHVEALAQPPRDEGVPAVRLGRTRPQQLVADRVGDLHRPPRGLEAGLDAQAVRERGRDADLEVAAGPPRRPLPEHGTGGVEVTEGAADVEVVGVDGVHQRRRHAQAGVDLRRALGVAERVVERERLLEVGDLAAEVADDDHQVAECDEQRRRARARARRHAS